MGISYHRRAPKSVPQTWVSKASTSNLQPNRTSSGKWAAEIQRPLPKTNPLKKTHLNLFALIQHFQMGSKGAEENPRVWNTFSQWATMEGLSETLWPINHIRGIVMLYPPRILRFWWAVPRSLIPHISIRHRRLLILSIMRQLSTISFTPK